jgi:hypothetical protein
MEIGLLAAIGGIVAFWVASLQARENALRVVRQACERDGLQLLDETAAVVRLRLGRDSRGQVRWRRLYRFEFAEGPSRRLGHAEFVGLHCVHLELERADFTLHEDLPEGDGP